MSSPSSVATSAFILTAAYRRDLLPLIAVVLLLVLNLIVLLGVVGTSRSRGGPYPCLLGGTPRFVKDILTAYRVAEPESVLVDDLVSEITNVTYRVGVVENRGLNLGGGHSSPSATYQDGACKHQRRVEMALGQRDVPDLDEETDVEMMIAAREQYRGLGDSTVEHRPADDAVVVTDGMLRPRPPRRTTMRR
ncbi:hypothetical protein [Halalkalicoccus sp. NIPERK01]|uniref:hypothetical protein n=1 Tax=Halalkalicoccus sp. NIPERK01 TaxID=3053469 RepID=UPI00256EE9EF|nr:hypothetical protein [Halalkalicoccus sp. NIPERK01]MDL5363142.1 hypothetical protein [Halalkalicoccus sp. NIPERK01]